jgi:hypothetical protein
MTANRALAAILTASLAGCSSAPQHGAVNFYPVNAEANAIGIPTGEYQNVGPGAGSLRAVMPDGEVLTGQCAIVQAGASGFGSIYASAFAPLAIPGVVYGRSRTAERSSPCLASLVGDHGTTLMQCEFYYDNVFHHGYGGCRSSRGAVFRLQF